MIWPGNLVSVTLMNAMYETTTSKKDPTILGGSIARYRWFAYVGLGAFVYYFIPGFLAQFLSVFAFATVSLRQLLLALSRATSTYEVASPAPI